MTSIRNGAESDCESIYTKILVCENAAEIALYRKVVRLALQILKLLWNHSMVASFTDSPRTGARVGCELRLPIYHLFCSSLSESYFPTEHGWLAPIQVLLDFRRPLPPESPQPSIPFHPAHDVQAFYYYVIGSICLSPIALIAESTPNSLGDLVCSVISWLSVLHLQCEEVALGRREVI